MFINRRTFSIAAASALTAGASRSQSYPNRPVSLVVGFAAGGGVDFIMRTLSTGWAQRLGQPVIVDNRPGASATIAATHVARATPDGHTLFGADGGSLALNGALYSRLAYDPIKDFAPISLVMRHPILIVANPEFPVNDLRGLIEYAQRQPGGLSYGSPGNGTYHHLGMELLKRRARFEAVPIPYKGAAPTVQDVMGGQVPIAPIDTIPALPLIAAGKLKALVVLDSKRLPQLPNVPTAAEMGVDGVQARSWVGVLAPRATPAATVERLSHDVRELVKMPDVVKKFSDLGLEAAAMAPGEFAAFVQQEIARWHPLIKELNIKLD